MSTFAEYLEKWLKHLTPQGLNNPLVKMPVKRFRSLNESEFENLKMNGKFLLGTMADPISRNLFKNFQTRMRERGEHSAYWTFGSIETTIASTTFQNEQAKKALLPILVRRRILNKMANV